MLVRLEVIKNLELKIFCGGQALYITNLSRYIDMWTPRCVDCWKYLIWGTFHIDKLFYQKAELVIPI